MHRHGYKGRKFGRERDQRRALMKGLASSLVEYQSIETTLPKAKELEELNVEFCEKNKKLLELITQIKLSKFDVILVNDYVCYASSCYEL